MYVQDSWAHGDDSRADLLHAAAVDAEGGDEATTDLAHLRDPQLMEAYWQDVTAVPARAGTKPVVVHVEPDLWGYLEQANAVASRRAFAQKWVALRNQFAPNVLLAYHMSGWGTKHDIVYEDPRRCHRARLRGTVGAVLPRVARAFDLSFEDFSDRDAGFYEQDQGNPKTWFTRRRLPPASAVRRDLCEARRRAHGRLADPARQHVPARTRGDTFRTTASNGFSIRRIARTCARTSTPATSASCSAAAPTAPHAPQPTAATSSSATARTTGRER